MQVPESNTPQAILLIDDEPMIIATLAEALRNAGFDVTASSSPSEAIEIAGRERFALAIVDYAMPELNGLETAARFVMARQPFMFLSAYSEPELVEQAISAGALAYVVKPVDPAQLVPTVRAAVKRAREIAALLEQADRLSKAVDTSREVSIAVGLVMAQRGLTRQLAYESLRQHARRQRRRLTDVACEITAGAESLYSVSAVDPLRRPGELDAAKAEEKK